MTKAETNFVDQMTRKMTVAWAHGAICGKDVTNSVPASQAAQQGPYVEYAQTKGWVSKDGSRILAVGFKTAAAFLRR